MEVIDYGLSQVVNLMNVFRPQGNPYYPEIAAKVAVRYQFAKPPGLEDMGKESIKFQVGKFNDVQISEFGIYSDGVIVNGRCPTELLEEFLYDLLSFSAKEVGYEPVLKYREELHFESIVTVNSDADLAAFIVPSAQGLISKAIGEKINVPLRPAGISLDFDTTGTKLRRKPSRFLIERRIGFRFDENLFHSIAPLRTKDHLALLGELERAAKS